MIFSRSTSTARSSEERASPAPRSADLNLLTLADFKGVRVTDEQVSLLLDAMGVDVRTRQP